MSKLTANMNYIEKIVTPTVWQNVLLRNYGLIAPSRIAKVLKCSTTIITNEANRLGLGFIKWNPLWRKKSYLTIIRNNWNLLPNNQIIQLLGITLEQFDYELKENDFLGIKLGNKTKLDNVYYFPLNKKQKNATNKIKKIIEENYIQDYAEPFSFNYLNKHNMITTNNKKRIIYPYSVSCGDIFLSNNIVSETELKALKNQGINGIWLSGVLSYLTPYPFSKNNDDLYLKRLQNLNILINKCKKYNIGLYLYFNEPRGIKQSLLKEEYSHLSGRHEDDQIALCISQKEVQNYLLSSIKFLLENVKELEGIITITSSENLTHCKHTLGSDCPKCKDKKPYQLAVLINNIFQQAIEETNSNTKLIANLWGWAPYCGFTEQDIKEGIKELNPKITLLFVSEFGTHEKNGQTYDIGEYSISHGEPCLETIKNIEFAKLLNRKIMTKIQINNCWEIATIPYYPTYELAINHLEKLQKIGVYDYMLSWTLGGYPSPLLSLANSLNDHFSYDDWLKKYYGKDYKAAKKAIHIFSEVFKLYPFGLNELYYSPIHLGPLNPCFERNQLLNATMVTFPYNDIKSWVNSNDDINQFIVMAKRWKTGLKYLKNVDTKNKYMSQLIDISFVISINIESFINQYMYYSEKITKTKYIQKELTLVKLLYKIASKNPTIGFEASNQYMFTQNQFIEKIISLNTK